MVPSTWRRTSQSGSPADGNRRVGFTLTELVVVIGLLALLMAILLPSLSRANETAKRAQCASNLHNLGAACHAFALDHNGYFPMCYRAGDPTQPPDPTGSDQFRMPGFVRETPTFDTDFANWQKWGTSYGCFKSYGMVDRSWTCPSANLGILHFSPAIGYPAMYGTSARVDYMYLGGLRAASVGVASTLLNSNWVWPDGVGGSRRAFGTAAIPAVQTSDSDLSNRILGGDLVRYSGGSGSGWEQGGGARFVINHINSHYSTSSDSRPDFQNLLYGDGHVEPKTIADYPDWLGNGYTWVFEAKGNNNGSLALGLFYYWGENPLPPAYPPGPPGGPPPPPPPLPPALPGL
jgi:type II secretory pathway pseudopilin PulG